ncbi:MAG: hypothetical protein JSR91_00180 [Proteobacteria bacterium]|nr:hypothetical protein [Pseudomonadota bacterium]
MRLTQFVVSVVAAYAFLHWHSEIEAPTGHSWLLGVLIVGVGAAWLFTVIVTRLSDLVRYRRR